MFLEFYLFTFWKLILNHPLHARDIHWDKVYIIETFYTLNATISKTIETIFYSCEAFECSMKEISWVVNIELLWNIYAIGWNKRSKLSKQWFQVERLNPHACLNRKRYYFLFRHSRRRKYSFEISKPFFWSLFHPIA